jgi:NitT/TauT family transport system permease protein
MTNSTLALATKIDVDNETELGAVSPALQDQKPSAGSSVSAAGASEQAKHNIAGAIQSVDWLDLVRSWTVRTLSLMAGLLIWQLVCAYKFNFFINFENVPSPLVVLAALIKHAHETKFYIHILVSIRRILIGFALATVIGISLGVLMGRMRIARDIVVPYIEILRPIPAVAWIPLAILMWPTEESSIIYITFLGALFPIVLNTVHGVEQTPDVLVRAAQSLGAKRLHIFWHVVMPAALPSIATGLAIGMGVSWFSLLAGEIISGQYGIGYFTWNAYSLIDYPDIVVGMLVIGLLGTLSTLAVRKITQPLLSWQRKSR